MTLIEGSPRDLWTPDVNGLSSTQPIINYEPMPQTLIISVEKQNQFYMV